ncbi:MAG: HAD-IB family phosphatase [bacterium]|nr:HAD-IB family phosphatase [bacterium]
MPLDRPQASRVRWPEFSHVIFDCDSTLSTIEGIDVLATSLGLESEVAALTDAAMDGDAELDDVYRDRLAMLRPSKQAIADLRAAYKSHIVPAAREVIAALQEIEVEVYVVSGGLAEPVEEFATNLGIDPSHVRAVAARHDSLSGEWWKSARQAVDEDYSGFDSGALTRSDGKAEIIAELLTGASGTSMLVGDGASDLQAAPAVDLFVGFGGVVTRDRVAAAAPIFITADTLAPVLPIAAGPGGRQRLASAAGRGTFSDGVARITSGEVLFRDAAQKAQLLAALNVTEPDG